MLPPYTINPYRYNTKHIRLTITRDGILKVSKPKHITLIQVEDFILSKVDWIDFNLTKIKSAQAGQYQIDQGEKKSQIKLTRRDYILHKNAALKLVTAKLALYNKYYNFSYKNITIKNTKTRWGSCSRRGNLNFNYKIALIPDQLADYIIVHELCHLGQFNHSQKFWDLVKETIPDYLEKVKELKDLHI